MDDPSPHHPSQPFFSTTQPGPENPLTPVHSLQPQNPSPPSSSISQRVSHEQSRVAALRGELQSVQAGVVRILSGLQELGENVPGSRESVFRSDLLENHLQNLSATSRQSASDMADRRGRYGGFGPEPTTRHTPHGTITGHVENGVLHTSFTPYPGQPNPIPGVPAIVQTPVANRNPSFVLSTREEVENPEYQSPIAGMYQRAYDRYRQAESRRRADVQTQPPECPPSSIGEHNGQATRQEPPREEQSPPHWGPTSSASQPQMEATSLTPNSMTPSSGPHAPLNAPHMPFNPLQNISATSASESSAQAINNPLNQFGQYPATPGVFYGAFVPTPPNTQPQTTGSYLPSGLPHPHQAPHIPSAGGHRHRQGGASRRRNAASDLHPARQPFVSPAGHDEPVSPTTRRAAAESDPTSRDAAYMSYMRRIGEYNFQTGRSTSQRSREEIIRRLVESGIDADHLSFIASDDFDDGPHSPKMTFDTQKRPSPLPEEELMTNLGCSICHEHKVDTIVLPCGHAAMCNWCAELHVPTRKDHRTIPRERDAKCPICRKTIKEIVSVPQEALCEISKFANNESKASRLLPIVDPRVTFRMIRACYCS